MTVIGIDAGGTRTTCLLADASTGAVLAEARGPGANLQSHGAEAVRAVLDGLISRVLAGAPDPAVICLGMAGVDRPVDVTAVRDLMAHRLPGARCVVVSDALIALEAGLPGEAGVVIIAGTGSIAYGRNRDARAARAGGWGYVLGDEGSGYWLGRHALRAVVRASDGRGPETALTTRVLEHYGATRAQDLIRQIAGSANPSAIAELARVVAIAAEAGDPVAHLLVKSAAQELAGAAVAVVQRLALPEPTVLLAGGTLLGVDLLQRAVVADLARRWPSATPVRLAVEPALGAVRFACDELAGRLTLPAYVD